MLLQVAIDKPESLGVITEVRGIADIIEIGTPLLKRFGIGAVATARELCPDTPLLADTKTVDAGDRSTKHIDADSEIRRRGFRVALAGGLGPETLDAVLEAEPEIVIVGAAITGASDPRRVAKWIKDRLRNPGRGWPSDAR